jgi:hypothetical protein
MEEYRLPKQLLKYHPKGKQRALKRLLGDMIVETETGHHGPN